MAQEILLKQEKTSASMIMTALANASTNSESHVMRSAQAGRFLLSDLNKLFTKAKRINTSWTGGTPADRRGRGITDLLVSPEIVEEIRGLAYNPINSRGGAGGAPTAGDGIAGTDSMRDAIFNSAGIPEFYGVSIQEYNEMGISQKWNDVFAVAAANKTFADNYSVQQNGGTAFEFGDANADGDQDDVGDNHEQILVGVDLSRESMIRAVATDSESGDEFSLVSDDQFVTRQSKIGYYGSLEEGRMIIDDRVLLGLIV
jgi:hypothetical protein